MWIEIDSYNLHLSKMELDRLDSIISCIISDLKPSEDLKKFAQNFIEQISENII